MDKKILVVDDEKDIVDIIKHSFLKENYIVFTALDGEAGYKSVKENSPDLILLDVMMPKIDGIQLCKKLRAEGIFTPIIMLTAKAEETDKISGLQIGADDYMVKPFSLKELSARVSSLLRRANMNINTNANMDSLEVHDLKINFDRYEILKRDQVVELTKKEFDIVKLLVQNQGSIFSRESLLEKIWGYEYFGDDRTVDVTIRRIRMKLEDNPDTPRYIMTKRGVGYYFG